MDLPINVPIISNCSAFLTVPLGATILGLLEVDGVDVTLIVGVGIEFESGQLLTFAGLVPFSVVTPPVNCNLPEFKT